MMTLLRLGPCLLCIYITTTAIDFCKLNLNPTSFPHLLANVVREFSIQNDSILIHCSAFLRSSEWAAFDELES